MSVPAEKYGLGMLIQQSCQPTPKGIIRLSKCIITYRRRHLATSKHVINITQSIEMFSSQT